MGSRQSYITVVVILLGCLLVALSLYFKDAVQPADGAMTIQRADASARHMYGSKRADTVIVEFSDFQCPYCARLHATLAQIVDESGGSIAWEYRHLPLASHPLAEPLAIAAECVAQNASKDDFWDFAHAAFGEQRSLTSSWIENKLQTYGISGEELSACQADPQILQQVEEDKAVATALGGSGTPFSVIIYPDNSTKSVSGAVPYEQWQAVLTK